MFKSFSKKKARGMIIFWKTLQMHFMVMKGDGEATCTSVYLQNRYNSSARFCSPFHQCTSTLNCRAHLKLNTESASFSQWETQMLRTSQDQILLLNSVLRLLTRMPVSVNSIIVSMIREEDLFIREWTKTTNFFTYSHWMVITFITIDLGYEFEPSVT